MAFTPLNAFNAFIAVARRRSYAVAANDLGISTSVLSQSVRQPKITVQGARYPENLERLTGR